MADGNADPVALAQRIQPIATDKSCLLSVQTEIDHQRRVIRVEAPHVVGSKREDFYNQAYGALKGLPLRKADPEAKTRAAPEAVKHNTESLTVRLGAAGLDQTGMPLEARAKAESDQP